MQGGRQAGKEIPGNRRVNVRVRNCKNYIWELPKAILEFFRGKKYTGLSGGGRYTTTRRWGDGKMGISRGSTVGSRKRGAPRWAGEVGEGTGFKPRLSSAGESL